MFFPDSQACSEPNSQTPMSAARIRRADLVMQSYASHFISGDAALNDLIRTLGGNSPNVVAGDAGVPTGYYPSGGPIVLLAAPPVPPPPLGSVASLLDPGVVYSLARSRLRRYMRLTSPGDAIRMGTVECKPPEVIQYEVNCGDDRASSARAASAPAAVAGISAGWWLALIAVGVGLAAGGRKGK